MNQSLFAMLRHSYGLKVVKDPRLQPILQPMHHLGYSTQVAVPENTVS